MILLKRVRQPPRLAWIVWDEASPGAIVQCELPEARWMELVMAGPDAVREAVREVLLAAVEAVREFNQQLSEL